jgi:hypothetical protein
MKKLFFVLLMCSMVNFAQGAAIKIALVGNSPEANKVADLVLVEMQKDNDIEFLERNDVKKILKEHKLIATGMSGYGLVKLNQFLHVDLFAVISSKTVGNKTIPSAVLVFDARNGFRLENVSLSVKNNIQQIAKTLRQAVKKSQQPSKQILLSVAAIRNAGVAEHFKYKMAFIAADIERKLQGLKNIAVLERNYLGNVNRERKLTHKVFKLAPSAFLLRLEFSPESTPKKIKLKLRITNAANKELFEFEINDCLGNANLTSQKMLKAIADYLNINHTETSVSSTQEAERFFAEFKFLNRMVDYVAARSKLNAAIALNPGKFIYRKALIKLNTAQGRIGHVRNSIIALEENLNLIKQMQQESFDCSGLYIYDYLYWYLSNKRQNMDKKDIKKMQELARIYRPAHLEFIRKRYYKFDLKDGINSVREWNFYTGYCASKVRFSLYWDAKKWGEINYITALRNLKLSRKFYEKNPKFKDKGRLAAWTFCLLGDYRSASSWGIVGRDIKNAVINLIRNSSLYIKEASSHPFPSVRASAIELNLLRKTVISKFSESEFEKNVKEYYKQMNQVTKGGYKARNNDSEIMFFLQHGSALSKIMWKVKRENLNITKTVKNKPGKAPRLTRASLFNLVKRESNLTAKAKKALQLWPQLCKYIPLTFTDPEVRDFFLRLRLLLMADPFRKTDPVFEKLRKTVNSRVDIKVLCSLEKKYGIATNGNGINIENVLYQNNTLYLLMCETRRTRIKKSYRFIYHCRWTIARMNFKTQQLEQNLPWSEWERLYRPRIEKTSFSINNNLGIASLNKNVYVFPLDGNKPWKIKDLPGQKVMALSLLADRLYIFTGKSANTVSSETILLSCKTDGTDRVIHLSSSRDKKQNDLERKKPFFVHTMYCDERQKRLIFSCASPNRSGTVSGLWEFYPASGKSKCLFNIKWRPIDRVMTKVNDKIFFSFFYEQFCIYDISGNTGDVFFSTVNRKAKNYLKVKFRAAQGIYYYPPFFARPKQIWFGGDNDIKMISLPDAAKSPLIMMPQVSTVGTHAIIVFPHPDGISAIAIDKRNIYKITPQ